MVDVPPPPENPFMNENGNPDPYANGDTGETLDQGTPDVAARPGRVLIVLGVVGLILAFLLYTIFSSDKKAAGPSDKKIKLAPDVSSIDAPPLPTTPEAPPTNLTLPNIGAGAPAIPAIPTPIAPGEIISQKEDGTAKQAAQERMKSKMFVSDNSGGGALSSLTGGSDKPSTPAGPTTGDPNATFAAQVAANSQAEKAQATQIGDLSHTIAQGRIIQATMESALNTDLPAPIRAIVSRDTYGEAGREPLIPKGSRLIGTYNTDISGAQSRVFVVWTRVIRPDGVDIQIGSPLVDQIGQAGIGGQIDTKFQSIFSRSILASVVSISAAIASDSISGGSTTTTSNGSGTTTSGDAATTATVDALNRLGGVSDSFIKRFLDVRPTILVDQGTPVNVFVNRDLIFPAQVTQGTHILN